SCSRRHADDARRRRIDGIAAGGAAGTIVAHSLRGAARSERARTSPARPWSYRVSALFSTLQGATASLRTRAPDIAGESVTATRHGVGSRRRLVSILTGVFATGRLRTLLPFSGSVVGPAGATTRALSPPTGNQRAPAGVG